jgi:hypothetical protein
VAESYERMGLKSYHYAWLSVRPHRTEDWLRERLRDGFDLHHADGNHANDDPSNLVLIEASDHMRLHNRPGTLLRLLAKRREDSKARQLEIGRTAASMRASGISWDEIERAVGVRAGTAATYMGHARRADRIATP